MVMDLKLFAVGLCVLVLCDQTFTRCKINEKRCKKRGGQCYRQDENPSGFQILKECQGNCKCYKEAENIPTFLSETANMTNMTDITIMNMIINDIPSMASRSILSNRTDNSPEERTRNLHQRAGSCRANEWDGSQYCRCESWQRISRFKSDHDNHREDRKWNLECGDIMPTALAKSTTWETTWSGYMNDWDEGFHWSGGDKRFMSGMQSYHHNRHEDRRYQILSSCSDDWIMSGCTGWIWLNGYDGRVDKSLGSKQVIASILSSHHNHHEDRRFVIRICNLEPRC